MRTLSGKYCFAVVAAACLLSACQSSSQRRDDEFDRQWNDMLNQSAGSGNIVIEVTRMSVDESESDALSAAFQYADENVRVAAGRPFRDGGFRAGYAEKGLQVSLDAVSAKSKTSSRTTQMIAVLPGNRGRIEFAEGAGLGGSASVACMDVVPALDVEDGSILLKLAPVFADGGGVTQLSTTVSVKSGQVLLLAANDSAQTTDASRLLSSASGSKRTRTLIALKATQSKEIYK